MPRARHCCCGTHDGRYAAPIDLMVGHDAKTWLYSPVRASVKRRHRSPVSAVTTPIQPEGPNSAGGAARKKFEISLAFRKGYAILDWCRQNGTFERARSIFRVLKWRR